MSSLRSTVLEAGAWLEGLSTLKAKQWHIVAAAAFGTTISINLLGKLYRNTVLVPRLTILHDLPKLGTERKDGKRKQTVVICGGSVAGLFAAAVCAQHFEKVILIEAEGSPEELGVERPRPTEIRINDAGTPVPVPRRKRVFQYKAPHLFMPPIILSLQRLFPNLQCELDNLGIGYCPLVWYQTYDSIPGRHAWDFSDPNAPQTMPISRELFETLTRRLVFKYRDNITFITGTVTGYRKGQGEKLAGVRYQPKNKDAEVVQPAHLIIDATGPSTHSYHKWLKDAGFDSLPQRDEYDPHQTYFNSVWTIPDQLQGQVDRIIPRGLKPGHKYGNNPDWSVGERRVFLISVYERRQIMVSMGGWGAKLSDRPSSVSEMRDFLRSMHNHHLIPGWIHELLGILERQGDEIPHFFSDTPTGKMSLIKYHEAKPGDLPINWLAMGDAMMKLNPIYGEGVKKAMTDAVSLDSILRTVPADRELPDNFSANYFVKTIARSIGPWQANKANDYGFPTTTPVRGENLQDDAFSRNFGRYLFYTGRRSRFVMRTIWLGIFGLSPHTDSMSPSTLVRVFWTWLTKWN